MLVRRLHLIFPPPSASSLQQVDGTHLQHLYEYSDDWQEKLLGGKMLEVGDIPCLGAQIVCIDPASADKPR